MINPTELEIAAISAAINAYLIEESNSSISNTYLTPWKVAAFNNFNISHRRGILGWTEKLHKQ